LTEEEQHDHNVNVLEIACGKAKEAFMIALDVIEDINPPEDSLLRRGAISIDSGWQLLEVVASHMERESKWNKKIREEVVEVQDA